MESHQKISMRDYQRLKTLVKRNLDQKLRLRNIDARHEKIEQDDQWPRCPHFKQTSLSVFPLPLPLPILPPFLWNPFPCSCPYFTSSPSRDDQIFHTRVALLVTMLLQCVYLRRCCVGVIGSTTHLVSSGCCCSCTRDIHKLSSKDCPRLKSLRIQQQVRRKLCVCHSVQNNPHTQAI